MSAQRARRTAAGLVAAALAALAACGGSSGAKPAKVDTAIPNPGATAAQTFAGQGLDTLVLEKLSKTLTTALEGRDEKAFLATIAPGHPGVVAQQRNWFRNVTAVPMTTRKLVVVRPEHAIDSSGKGVLTAYVGFVHEIKGADRDPIAEWYAYGFKKVGSGLRIVSVGGAPADTSSGEKYSRYYRQAWDDRGPMTVAADSKVVLLGQSSDAAALRRIRPTISGAVRDVLSRLRASGTRVDPSVWSRRWVFTLADSRVHDFFDYFGGIVHRREASFAAFTEPILSSGDAAAAMLDYEAGTTTSRIVLNRAMLGYSGASFAAIVRHEMVHAVQQSWEQDGTDPLPTWVTEGLAVYVSRPPASEASYRYAAGRRGLAHASKMPERSFYEGDDDAVAQHYGMGYVAVSYLAQKVGDRRLLSAVRAASLAGDDNLLERLGVPEQGFVAAVRKWATR